MMRTITGYAILLCSTLVLVAVMAAAVYDRPRGLDPDDIAATAPLGDFQSILWAHDGRAAVYCGSTVAIVAWDSITGVIPNGAPTKLVTTKDDRQYLVVNGYTWPVVGNPVNPKDY